MGVPKFYRWLSERYPCINENVNQYNIPEFDNFYVDMNGVFHICSHPSDDVHFRLSESQIFENIGIYVEFLFNLIQPRKVFFLSVDGVAPRSKMNQQRSRRYRTAKEAIEKEEKARRMGESLPDDPRFDSNCITPGTEFMGKLHNYMVEFLKNKIQNNQSWRDVEVIYSGYDVPGEGEHKIMDYVRYSKTKNTFDKNVRHCLYGLDADLINLGLSCHEPYFSLLREEVVFNKNAKRHCDPFKTNFQLLHLSILRNYLNLEFQELKPKIKFEYNLENIIDDWILMNFLIGNDFLPHIPKFHVDKGSIQILYDTYKEVLPNLDGYLNHEGTIQLERYRKYLQKLAQYDMDLYHGTSVDLKYFNQDFNNVTFGESIENDDEPFDFESNGLLDSEGTSDEKEELESAESDESEEDIEGEFTTHKNHYYQTKLHFENLESDVLNIVNEYVKGVQWVLYYYFNGCVSWNWFYPYYYAPYVSDLCKFDIVDYQFQKSKPFQPLVQLLAVIPQASKEILPKAYQKLTYNSDSPLIRFFPKEVEIDLNEKIHDYEAIVLIPFIEENVLLNVFKQHENELTQEEFKRNQFGVHLSMKHVDHVANEDGQFPNVQITRYNMDDFVLPPDEIYKGVRKNVNLEDIIGFPTLSGIKYVAKVDNARLKVFRFASQNPSMLLHVESMEFTSDQLMEYAKKELGQIVYINWPLLSEAKLIEIVNSEQKYVLNSKNQVVINPANKYELGYAKQSSNSHCSTLRNKKGVILDRVNVVAKVAPLQSQKYIITGGKVVLHKEWSKTEEYIPLELVICSDYLKRKFSVEKSLSTVFTKGKSFFLIGQPWYGYKTEVVEYIKGNNMVKANVLVTSEPDFSDIINNQDYILDENYIAENQLVYELKKKFNTSEGPLRRLLGSVLINCKADKGREKKVNLGLKLKYKSNMGSNIKPYCIPGYSLLDGHDMFYNRKVISVMENYWQQFGNVFNMLTSTNKPVYEMNDLFVDEPQLDKSEKIKKLCEIKDWLDGLELSKIGHFKSNSNYLDNCIVKAIEETIEAHSVLMEEKEVVQGVFPPTNFYVSEFVLKGSSLPDPRVKFFNFDRVVNIKKCIAVPYGAKGTVIGVYKKDDELNNHRGDLTLEAKTDEPRDSVEELMNSVIEVMFDEPFDGGLKTRSTKPNIYKMQAAWLINISYGLSFSHKKKPNFKYNYQSIQGYARGQQQQQPKTSTPNAKAARPLSYKQAATLGNSYNNSNNNFSTNNNGYNSYRNNNNYYNNLNNIPFPKFANKRQNKFNHSENSPFKKILNKNTQVESGSLNPSARRFVPNSESLSHAPHTSFAPQQPIMLPMPQFSAPRAQQTSDRSQQLKSMLNIGQQQPFPLPPQWNVLPNNGIQIQPPSNWIQSAKNKRGGGGERRPRNMN